MGRRGRGGEREREREKTEEGRGAGGRGRDVQVNLRIVTDQTRRLGVDTHVCELLLVPVEMALLAVRARVNGERNGGMQTDRQWVS